MQPFPGSPAFRLRRSPLSLRILAACVAAAASGPVWGHSLPASAPEFAQLPAPADPSSSTDNASGFPRLTLTWSDLEALADRHPLLASARGQVAAAEGVRAAAGAFPNPTLEASLGDGRPRGAEGARRREWALELSLPLDWLAARGPRVRAASAAVAAGRAEAAALRRDVLRDLRTLFWTAAHDQAQVATLEDLAGQTDALARAVTARVEHGEARPVEANRIEVEREKARTDLASARSQLRAELDQLAIWLDQDGGRVAAVEAALDDLPHLPDLETALGAARASHPVLAAQRSQVEALEAELAAERRARIPPPTLKAFSASELDRRAYGAGISFDVPLWNWNSGGIARAEGLLAAGRQGFAAGARSLDGAVIEAWSASFSARQAAVSYRDQILPRAEKAAMIAEKAYLVGESGLLELLDARRVLLETHRQALAAKLAAQLEATRLLSLTAES